jgi:hypothetical protein
MPFVIFAPPIDALTAYLTRSLKSLNCLSVLVHLHFHYTTTAEL